MRNGANKWEMGIAECMHRDHLCYQQFRLTWSTKLRWLKCSRVVHLSDENLTVWIDLNRIEYHTPKLFNLCFPNIWQKLHLIYSSHHSTQLDRGFVLRVTYKYTLNTEFHYIIFILKYLYIKRPNSKTRDHWIPFPFRYVSAPHHHCSSNRKSYGEEADAVSLRYASSDGGPDA